MSGPTGGQDEKSEGSGKTALTFFRVFDLAFFAPGALLTLGALHAFVVMPGKITLSQYKDAGTGLVLLLSVIGVLASFCAGTVVHTVARLFRVTTWGYHLAVVLTRYQWKLAKEGNASPAVYRCSNAATRNDLVTYFWYLRSTFANLAVAAAALGAMYASRDGGVTERLWYVVIGLVCGFLLAIGSGEYDITLKSLPEQPHGGG